MKPFVSFYDPKGMEPPINNQQMQRYEQLIIKEVEIAIKQIRSSKNLNTKLRNNASLILSQQLDYLEDLDCDRFINMSEQEAARSLVEKELLKMVPENYRIAILPAFFNYTDPERIITTIVDLAQDFILNRSK